MSACMLIGDRRKRLSHNCFACATLCSRASTLGRLEEFLRLGPAAGG